MEDPVEASLLHALLLGVSGFLVTALADDPLFYSEGQVVLWFVLGIGVTSFATAQRSPHMGVFLAGLLLALALIGFRSPGPLSPRERRRLRIAPTVNSVRRDSGEGAGECSEARLAIHLTNREDVR